MATFRIGLDTIRIDPRHGSRHPTKIQVIGHRMGVARLAFGAADLLLDLFESGFDFPPRAVKFDDLLDRKRQIGGEESDPPAFTKDPHDADLAAKVFQHDDLIIGEHLALLALEKNRDSTCLFTQQDCQFRSTTQSYAILPGSSPLIGTWFWR